jgi:hypothetical protein
MTPEQIAEVAYRAGFRGHALTVAVAVALAESAGKPSAHNRVAPDDSYGLWQINMIDELGPDRRHRYHLSSNDELLDPAVNARVAYRESDEGRDWRKWTTFTGGGYRAHLDAAGPAALRVTAAHDDTGRHDDDGRRAGNHHVVLDLDELRRLANLFQHSADRVTHTRRALRVLAAELEPARAALPDPALATIIGEVFATLDAPTELSRAADRLDRQGRYAAKVRQLAERADGPDGRWSAADAHTFLRSIGRDVDPFERAIQEAALYGTITHAAAHHRPSAGPPRVDLHGLVNGRIPPSRLTPIGDGERLLEAPAAQFRRMAAAANAAGLDLTVNDGYRTYQEQAELYRRYRAGTGALAAPPGHSTHGLGLSIDIRTAADPRVLPWLRRHAAEYGFVNDVPSENWHWTYRPGS